MQTKRGGKNRQKGASYPIYLRSFKRSLQSSSLVFPTVELCPWRLALSCTGPDPGMSSVVVLFRHSFSKASACLLAGLPAVAGRWVTVFDDHNPFCGSRWKTPDCTDYGCEVGDTDLLINNWTKYIRAKGMCSLVCPNGFILTMFKRIEAGGTCSSKIASRCRPSNRQLLQGEWA